MSTITVATRDRRLAAPLFPCAPGPTPKAGRGRPLAPGHPVPIGRTDRPVLRIVTGGSPPLLAAPPETHEPVRVDLEEFFVAEYAGDDQRLVVGAPRRSSVRLTRRGRMVILAAAVTVVSVLAVLWASGSAATDHAERTQVVVVASGQTLWDISARAAHRAGSDDIRSMMRHIEQLNRLDSTALQAGQRLRVPR